MLFLEKRDGCGGFYELRLGRDTVFWPLSERAETDAEKTLKDTYPRWWGGWHVPRSDWREVHKVLRDGCGHVMIVPIHL